MVGSDIKEKSIRELVERISNRIEDILSKCNKYKAKTNLSLDEKLLISQLHILISDLRDENISELSKILEKIKS